MMISTFYTKSFWSYS